MIRVRDAGLGDVVQICEYKRRSVSLNFPGTEFNPDIFKRHLIRQIESKPETVNVVEVDGKVAGYVWFRMVSSAVGVFGRVEHIFVDEQHRNKGLGKRLMQAVESYFREQGIGKIKLTVTLQNKAAISLYEKIGYRQARFVMEKDL